MKISHASAIVALLAVISPANAADVPKLDPAVVEKYVQSTFGKASPEWQARMKIDETLAVCNTYRNNPPEAEAKANLAREAARVVLPTDGKFTGDWKAGFKVANSGQGGQFSDKPGTVSGGNCYACHQMDPAEISYGTLGPSLKAYGRDRKFDAAEAKNAYVKIYNSHTAAVCSMMPRFGTNKILSEQQIKDVVAYLFDPASPVNK